MEIPPAPLPNITYTFLCEAFSGRGPSTWLCTDMPLLLTVVAGLLYIYQDLSSIIWPINIILRHGKLDVER